jgi:hypothetical protein
LPFGIILTAASGTEQRPTVLDPNIATSKASVAMNHHEAGVSVINHS